MSTLIYRKPIHVRARSTVWAEPFCIKWCTPTDQSHSTFQVWSSTSEDAMWAPTFISFMTSHICSFLLKALAYLTQIQHLWDLSENEATSLKLKACLQFHISCFLSAPVLQNFMTISMTNGKQVLEHEEEKEFCSAFSYRKTTQVCAQPLNKSRVEDLSFACWWNLGDALVELAWAHLVCNKQSFALFVLRLHWWSFQWHWANDVGFVPQFHNIVFVKDSQTLSTREECSYL